jgi:hypothetical protein
MNRLLHKYFALNHKLYIPGIGSFTALEKPALLDFANKKIYQPPYEIIYKQENSPADKNFFNFLCAQMHIEEWKAIIAFNDHAAHIKNVLTYTGNFTISGLGTLTHKLANEYSFAAEMPAPKLFPEISAERVIRKSAAHSVIVGEHEKTSVEMQQQIELSAEESLAETKKENWWLAAAILAAAGVIAILLYYLSS